MMAAISKNFCALPSVIDAKRICDALEFRRSEICTELAAKRVFVEHCHELVRYTREWGWLHWNGKCWERNPEAVRKTMEHVADHFRQLATQMHAEHEDAKLVAHVLAFARKLASERTMRDVLKLAEPDLLEKIEAFDSDPYLVNCANVTLALNRVSGEIPYFYEHSRADNLTQVIHHDWNMFARRVAFDAFLRTIFPVEAVRHFVKRAIGYTIIGTTREQCFFLCYGTGANGKSTMLNVLLRILGMYAIQADPRTFLAGSMDGAIRNDLADLYGKRLTAAIETGESKRLDEALVKAVTGGDMIRARHLYCEAFQYRPQFTLWLATNHRPQVRDASHAMWRRVHLIPFTATITNEQRDPDIESKLLAEAEGVLAWAVEGAVEYLREGLNPPTEITDATAEYRKSEDTLGRFMAERTVSESTGRVAKGELYQAFKAWAEADGEFVATPRKFNAYVKEQGFAEYRDGSARYWIGLSNSMTE